MYQNNIIIEISPYFYRFQYNQIIIQYKIFFYKPLNSLHVLKTRNSAQWSWSHHQKWSLRLSRCCSRWWKRKYWTNWREFRRRSKINWWARWGNRWSWLVSRSIEEKSRDKAEIRKKCFREKNKWWNKNC